MPRLVYMCPGLKRSTVRPVVFDIARQMLAHTGLPSDLPIRYNGEETSVNYQPGSTISEESESSKFQSEAQWVIRVEENYYQDNALSQAVYQVENPHIFLDEPTRVFLMPTYSHMEITLNLTYRGTDKDAARKWRDDLRTRVAMNRQNFLHEVDYHYLIPKEVMDALAMIHELQEETEPYNRTFDEYLKLCFTPRARVIVNQAGEHPTWAIAETQGRVQGFFEFELDPGEGQKDSDTASWSTDFSYKFRFDSPLGVVLEYPMVIHNQIVPEAFRPDRIKPEDTDKLHQFTLSGSFMRQFEKSWNVEFNGIMGVSIPPFDDWLPARQSVPTNTVRLCTVLCSIDPDQPLNLLDLSELGEDWEIDSEVLAFLIGEHRFLTKLGLSAFHISIYRNKTLMDVNFFEIDQNLMVKFKQPMSLRDVFHVRIALYERPGLLSQDAKNRLRNNCSVARKVMLALRPSLADMPNMLTCLPGNYMAKQVFDDANREIDRPHDPNYNGQIYQFNTVMSLLVTAKRI
jgi:hypothetical protein